MTTVIAPQVPSKREVVPPQNCSHWIEYSVYEYRCMDDQQYADYLKNGSPMKTVDMIGGIFVLVFIFAAICFAFHISRS